MSKKEQKVLFGLLGAALVAYLVTMPLRERLQRQVNLLHKQIALKEAQQHLQQSSMLLLDNMRQAAQAQPDSAIAQAQYASLLQQNGKYAEAIAQWLKTITLQPKSAEVYASLGDCYTLNQREDLAIKAYLKALQINPNNLHALTRLAVRYIALGWSQDAEKLINSALQRMPNASPLYVVRAMSDVQTAQFHNAQQDFRHAQRLNPSDTAIVPLRIDAYRKSGEYSKALSLIQKNLSAYPGSDALLVESAQIALAEHDPVHAEQELTAALKISPNDLQALLLRGEARRAQNNLSEAENDFRHVYSISPSYGQVALLLGQTLLARGKTAQAAPLMAKAAAEQKTEEEMNRLTLDVRNRPNDTAAHMAAAQGYMQSSQPARAIAEYNRALQINPHLAAARIGLQKALRQINGSS